MTQPLSDSIGAKQRSVMGGAALGLALSAALTGAILYLYPPVPPGIDRAALALRNVALPALTLAAGVLRVSRGRFRSGAIDPLAGRESPSLVIHGRYVENTTQQLVLLVIATFGLAYDLPADKLALLPAMAVVFVVGRVSFWMGYLRAPVLRAPGMAMTFMTTIIPTIYLAGRALYLALR